MKTVKYLVLVIMLGFMAASCTEEAVGPVREDDPIIIPPKPPKP
jgi:hypothetical protein